MPVPLTRRRVLALGGGAATSLALGPLVRFAGASSPPPGGDVLVWVFLLGGLDAPSAVVPLDDDALRRRRPTLVIPKKATLDLDGHFGLHPALAPLHRYWRAGRLDIRFGVGLPGSARSHFAAIDALARGTTGRSEAEGWLDRHAASTGARGRALHLGARVPGTRAIAPPTGSGDGFEGALRELAQRIRNDPGLRVASVGMGGWDTHEAQGGVDGWLAGRLRRLARGLDAFLNPLHRDAHRVTVVVSSEFGRSLSENARGGTDHGAGGLALVLGSGARGDGRVHGWTGVRPDSDALACTTDPRDLFASLVDSQLGAAGAARVFPAPVGAASRYA